MGGCNFTFQVYSQLTVATAAASEYLTRCGSMEAQLHVDRRQYHLMRLQDTLQLNSTLISRQKAQC